MRAPNRVLKGLAAFAAVALLGSCSATKFGYNRADWFAARAISEYVELEGPAEAAFDSGFGTLWQWHRGTQLAAYARDLRELADAVQGPLTTEQINGYLHRANDYGKRLLEEAVAPSARVLQSLDDRQVERLLDKMGQERAEEAEDDAKLTADERRLRSQARTARSLRRWFGALSDRQYAFVRDWAEFRGEDPALWRRYDEQWAAAFRSTLATRAEPGFEARLRALLFDPQLPDSAAARELNERNRVNLVDLMTRLAPTLVKSQRERSRGKLIGLAEDFEDLAATHHVASAGATP